jgi:uncharacterized protein
MKYSTIIIIVAVIVFVVVISAIIISKPQIPSIGDNGASTVVIPDATNYVVNSNGALKQATVDQLNTELKSFDGTAQIGVLVLDSTQSLDIEQYGIQLARKWKVGYSGKDNGAIIILATKDRKVRIEVGNGLEGDIPDEVAGQIMDDSMISSLKNNDWDTAIINGVHALEAQLKK